ncbi:Hpt domain-containing protein [Pseudohoeflea coraliihabitans]|uniref:Hpt domain-containing protein n=1 Tax=Pseudohoeflea coraliihabitans TaxID=2860393 RepID=A0ABS6WQY4_9HYPH|nr:Hpt domain-containing protein [Pseudohoeflea sp. DP4N28-3]MBW3098058.1 Hpt domain-containing protein [Pseudohoeflea sp. DP4N28-3]
MSEPNIAFAAPQTDCSARPSGHRPIDLVHLARQTGGDKHLESEVLALFARQLRKSTCEVAGLAGEARTALAHKICGSAKGVGAFDVARAAEKLETRPSDKKALAAFTKAAIEADNFILGLDR